MKNIFLLCFITFPCLLAAQFGLHGTFQRNTQNASIETEDFPITGLSLGLDYTFRLANNRIEFFPEINYVGLETHNIVLDRGGIQRTMNDQAFNFYFNTNFYIFDFEGDCDCPVFSKDGNFLKKGFFLQLSPGASYHFFNYTEEAGTPSDRTLERNSFSYSLGGGVGVDIGISEFITITPYFRARYHFPIELEDYPYSLLERQEEFAMYQINAGLRLGVQLTDEFTRNKRMRARRERSRNKKTQKRRR